MGIVGESLRIVSIGVHHVDFVPSLSPRLKEQCAPPLGDHDGDQSPPRILGESTLILPIDVHHVDLPLSPVLSDTKAICACASTAVIRGVNTMVKTPAKIKCARLYLRCICLSSFVVKPSFCP